MLFRENTEGHVASYDMAIVDLVEEAFMREPPEGSVWGHKEKTGINKLLVPNAAANVSVAFLGVSAAFLILSLVIGNRDFTTYSLGTVTFSLIAYEFFAVYGLIKKFFTSFMRNGIFSIAKEEYAEHEDYIWRLCQFSEEALVRVHAYLRYKATNTNEKIGASVGAMRKAGLFPSLLAMYIAYTKLRPENLADQEWITYETSVVITVTITGLYIVSAWLTSDLIKLESSIRMIESAIARLNVGKQLSA